MRIVVSIIGIGDVGGSLYRVFSSASGIDLYAYDIDPKRSINDINEIPKPVDFLHVSIPFKDYGEFVNSVVKYAYDLDAKAVIIHSTVAPGTTRKIYNTLGKPTAYSPVRGIRKNMVKHLYFWPKWISSLPESATDLFTDHLNRLGLKATACNCKPESLELAKLWETVYRALMIAAWQEIHRIAMVFDADIEVIARFINEVHRVLNDRPIYYPDFIGGRCLIPNTEILNKAYRSKMLEFILESNGLRRYEIENEKIKRDVDKVVKIASNSILDLYYS